MNIQDRTLVSERGKPFYTHRGRVFRPEKRYYSSDGRVISEYCSCNHSIRCKGKIIVKSNTINNDVVDIVESADHDFFCVANDDAIYCRQAHQQYVESVANPNRREASGAIYAEVRKEMRNERGIHVAASLPQHINIARTGQRHYRKSFGPVPSTMDHLVDVDGIPDHLRYKMNDQGVVGDFLQIFEEVMIDNERHVVTIFATEADIRELFKAER